MMVYGRYLVGGLEHDFQLEGESYRIIRCPMGFQFSFFFGCQIQHFSTKELRQGSAFVSLPGKANEVEQLLRVLKMLVPQKKTCDSLMGFNGIQWD